VETESAEETSGSEAALKASFFASMSNTLVEVIPTLALSLPFSCTFEGDNMLTLLTSCTSALFSLYREREEKKKKGKGEKRGGEREKSTPLSKVQK